MLQLRHVAFLNLYFDRTWPAFPHEKQAYEFDWGEEGNRIYRLGQLLLNLNALLRRNSSALATPKAC